jgi:hypothetical protein
MDGTISLELTSRELQAIRGSLFEADEAITDDVAFSARVGRRDVNAERYSTKSS